MSAKLASEQFVTAHLCRPHWSGYFMSGFRPHSGELPAGPSFVRDKYREVAGSKQAQIDQHKLAAC